MCANKSTLDLNLTYIALELLEDLLRVL